MPAKPPHRQEPVKGERIAKVLARIGIASRRGVEAMIAEGRISVDGKVLKTPAVLVTGKEMIRVDGDLVGEAPETKLWRYHKPLGLVTSHKDEKGRKTVFETLPASLPRVISVGRLDLNSEGLLLLTNDGELARKLELPRNGWERTYKVRAFGAPKPNQLENLAKGVNIDGIMSGPIHARELQDAEHKASGRNRWYEVKLSEGRNREVRKALGSIGLQVNRLIRTQFGPFTLGQLQKGGLAEVNSRQIKSVLKQIKD